MHIHWDYADSFSGRDAAYLIAGFDPSSNSAEDAYRAQHVIRKLKESYYGASTALAKYLRGDDDSDKSCNWRRLLTFQKEKSQISSIEIEKMVANFRSSEFVTKGHLQAIEEIEAIISTGFPDRGVIRSLREQVEATDAAIESLFFELEPGNGERLRAVSNMVESLGERREKYQLSLKQYQAESRPLFLEKAALLGLAERCYADRNPESYQGYKSTIEKISTLASVERDWSDAQATERGVRLQKARQSYYAADLESSKWAGAANEFDEQRFSRFELHRWVSENGHQSKYQFAPFAQASNVMVAAPWGAHSTFLLEKLSKAASKWWSNYDPSDSTTAPTNETVTAWLVDEGVSKRIAETMATILRADGLSTGRRG